ncbi:MAG: hypothetical protein ACTMHL_03810 [Janibacter sp.]
MSSVPHLSGPGSAAAPHHPTPEQPRPAHSGLVHLVPTLVFVLGGIAYPLVVLYRVFTTANADPVTVAGAPYAAAVAASLAFVAGMLIAGFITMLAYTVARFGPDHRTQVIQLVGVSVTLVGAIAGLALVFVVASM